MNYRSNLEAPDLRPYFKHRHERVTPESFGHDVISDWADKNDDDPVFGVYKKCGFWTLDEAAILYNCVKKAKGAWLDIGGHTGWTAAYACVAGYPQRGIAAIDPMYRNEEFRSRAYENVNQLGYVYFAAMSSDEFFREFPLAKQLVGVIIDGEHGSPQPLRDAQNASKWSDLIIFHDFRIDPVKDAYRWLLDNGFQGRTYTTPFGVAVCWRGDFIPPEHVPDRNLPPV